VRRFSTKPVEALRPLFSDAKMTFMTGIDPSSLHDLEHTTVKSRYLLDAKDPDDEPETLDEAHRKVQPRWLRIAMVVFMPPLAIVWIYMIQSGQAFENERLMFGIFGVVGIFVLLQFFFIARAYWRMDI
jgi:hypothetical protein